MSKADRGFASMDREKHREIARKGGLAVSQNKLHMAEIGRMGGTKSGESRARKNEPIQEKISSDLSQTMGV